MQGELKSIKVTNIQNHNKIPQESGEQIQPQ